MNTSQYRSVPGRPHVRYIEATEDRPRRYQVKCCGVWMSTPYFTNECGRCGAEYNWHGAALVKNWRMGEAGDYLNEG